MTDIKYAAKRSVTYENNLSLMSDYIKNPVALNMKAEISEIYEASCGGGYYGNGGNGSGNCGGNRLKSDLLKSSPIKQ